MKHTIGMTVYNEPGVMTKISGMFARRGFNIEEIIRTTWEEVRRREWKKKS